MDFLIRHYEKLILVVCLLLLLYSLQYVSNSQTISQRKTAEVKSEVSTLIKGDDLIEEMNTDSFESLDSMLSGGYTQFSLLSSPNDGIRENATRAGLLEGGKFVICKNKNCGYVLPFDVDVCPWCQTEQAPVGPDMPEDFDMDKDGIPDAFEKDTAYLHYRYRFDAMEDFDQDGFLNIEEYRAGTAMDDPKSMPALAYLLRVESAEQKALPVALRKVKQNGSANPNDWKATLRVDGEARTLDVKNGAAIPKMDGFKLTAFAPDMNSITISNGEVSFTLVAGADNIREENYSITLHYMGNHMFGAMTRKIDLETMLKEAAPVEQDPRKRLQQQQQQGMQRNAMGMDGAMGGMGGAMGMDGGMGMGNGMGAGSGSMQPQLVFEIAVGEVFPLKKESLNAMNRNGMGGSSTGMSGMNGMSYYDDEDNQPIVEYYRLLEIIPSQEEDGNPTVRVQKLTGQFGAADGEPIVVPFMDKVNYLAVLNSLPDEEPNHDYLPPTNGRNGGMGGGTMGGMGGMDGGMMGAPMGGMGGMMQ